MRGKFTFPEAEGEVGDGDRLIGAAAAAAYERRQLLVESSEGVVDPAHSLVLTAVGQAWEELVNNLFLPILTNA